MADVTTKRYASAGLTKKKGLLASYESNDDLDMISGRSQAGSDRKELDWELRSCWKASPERIVIIYVLVSWNATIILGPASLTNLWCNLHIYEYLYSISC
jgi:hypothetical protein